MTKTKSVKCSSVLAMACVMLELKLSKNCSQLAACETLSEDFPLLNSDFTTLSLVCILSCTLYIHRLKARLIRVVLATVTKTKSVKCSSVLAMACVMLELKLSKNCSQLAACETLSEDFPLLNSDFTTLSLVCILSCTLYIHRLKAAA